MPNDSEEAARDQFEGMTEEECVRDALAGLVHFGTPGTKSQLLADQDEAAGMEVDSGHLGPDLHDCGHSQPSMPYQNASATPKDEEPEPSTNAEARYAEHLSNSIINDRPDSTTGQAEPARVDGHRLVELRDIISDLQQRTESLLRRTRPRAQVSEDRSPRILSQRNSNRSHSTPPPFAKIPSNEANPSNVDSFEQHAPEDSPETLSAHVLSSPTPSQSIRSDSSAPYNRSGRSLSPRPNTRAHSEPPRRRRNARVIVDISQLSNGQTSAARPSDTSRSQYNQSNDRESTHKRKASHDPRQPVDDRDRQDRPSGPKRCKLTGRHDDITNKERFPCIFHAGEPAVYHSDDKKYEYISQLLRHLRRHDFYACPKCYSKFEDGEAQDLHAHENPCLKSCRNRRCTRFLPSSSARNAGCECILSPEQQWRQLFLLQYPTLPVPNLAMFGPQDTVQDIGPMDNEGMALDGFWNELTMEVDLTTNLDGTLDATSDDTVYNSIERINLSGNEANANNTLTQSVNPNIDSQQSALPLPGPIMTGTNGASAGEAQDAPPLPTNIQIDETFFTEVQTLRQRVQLLEQRLSQPSDREQDLEMVLGNVWQALVRTRSADAQPESPVWRLVRRFAGSILSTVPRPSTDSQPMVPQAAPSAFQWQDVLGACVPSMLSSSRTGGDSGYGSLP